MKYTLLKTFVLGILLAFTTIACSSAVKSTNETANTSVNANTAASGKVSEGMPTPASPAKTEPTKAVEKEKAEPTPVAGSKAETASSFETRCGWFANPTPANAWLNDKDGEWTIGVQGGYQAEGDWPDFSDSQWVKTNVNYGYGCACMSVKVNRQTHQITEIKKATARPLSVCRADHALKEPKG